MESPHIYRQLGILAIVLLAITITLLIVERIAYAQGPTTQATTTQSLEDLPELVPKVPVLRDMKGDESHSYRVLLETGQFLRLMVDQRGIDVTVTVVGPDARQLAEVDSPNGEQGSERVFLLAEASGSYRVFVRPLKKNAPAGHYVVKIDELRSASTQDRSLIAAETAYAAGDRARLQPPKDRQLAIKKYEEALELYRAASDRSGEIAALNILAGGYHFLGEKQRALQSYDQVLQLYRATTDRAGEANTLHSIGAIYNSYGPNSSPQLEDRLKALEYFDQAVALYKVTGDKKREAYTLTEIGGVYNALGERLKALEYFNLALPIQQAADDRRRQAYTLNYIGGSYASFGEKETALRYFGQAASLHKTNRDRFGEGSTLTQTGGVYFSIGETQKALECFQQALPLHQAERNRGWEASTLTQIGAVYYSLGDRQTALDYFNKALLIQRDSGKRGWESFTLSYIGAVSHSLGDWQKAFEHFDKALSLSREMGDRNGEANVLLNIARAERDRGNLTAARQHTENALNIIESLRTMIVSQEWRASYLASKRDYYEFYIELLMRLHADAPAKGHDAAALIASERAQARSLLETLTEAGVDIRQGVDKSLLEREGELQRHINAEELRRLQQPGKSTKEQAETTDELSALLTELRKVQAQIRARSPRYAALKQPAPLSVREIQQQVLDDETLLLEYSLGEEKSYVWAVTRTELKSFELPKRAVVEAAARRAYELLLVSHRTDAKRASKLAAIDLSRMVLGPASGLLKKKRLLIVADGALHYVPFAALPLPTQERIADGMPNHPARSYEPLIVKHEVISLPSASVLGTLRRETSKRQSAPQSVAVLADAVFQSDDSRLDQGRLKPGSEAPAGANQAIAESTLVRSAGESGVSSFKRLPFSRLEAEAIVAQAGESESFRALDFVASRETVFDTKLDQYRVIHFATHGILNSQHPALSGVVLSLFDKDGRPVDGFLRAHEIYNLKLNADLVVLSGCRTALGKEIKGEGLVGLTRGFMYAGARSVVASLWDVRDEATSVLMSRFYKELFKGKLGPSAALRAAQLSMLNEKRWEAPYYWAGFVQQGEWR